MPIVAWAGDPVTVARDYAHRQNLNDHIGPFFLWSTWAVESLYYLIDLDDKQYDFSRPNPVEPYRLEVVDIAHVRWAAGTAITALDLCAAGLGRQYCNWTRSKELDLRNFNRDYQDLLVSHVSGTFS